MGGHRLRHDYARASKVATMIYNMARDPKKARQLREDELNPYAAASGGGRGRVATKADFDRLRRKLQAQQETDTDGQAKRD